LRVRAIPTYRVYRLYDTPCLVHVHLEGTVQRLGRDRAIL